MKRFIPLIILLSLILLWISNCYKSKSNSFIVAGHTYGSPTEDNIGLYPKFLNHLKKNFVTSKFLILTGDIVRNSNEESWTKTQNQLDKLNKRYFLVMGNHDVSSVARQIFKEKYGDTYYSFNDLGQTFIILDTQRVRGNITDDQIDFIKTVVSKNPKTENIFLFFHELIWTAHKPKYVTVVNNNGSYNSIFKSNFWDTLFPLLRSYKDKHFYIITGDVGGNTNATPAFYEELGNVTLVASGMGKVRDENFLHVTVNDNNVKMQLIPLNKDNKLKPLKEYNPIPN